MKGFIETYTNSEDQGQRALPLSLIRRLLFVVAVIVAAAAVAVVVVVNVAVVVVVIVVSVVVAVFVVACVFFTYNGTSQQQLPLYISEHFFFIFSEVHILYIVRPYL